MKKFIGTKVVRAEPLTLGAYNHLRGWEQPADENPDAPGYLVEYLDGGKPNHPSYEHYISWSPAEVFEGSYLPLGPGMSFSSALRLLKQGKAVSRRGWNGKGMFIYLVSEGRYPPSTPTGELLADRQPDGKVPYRPYLAMKTVDDDVVPWVASQTDILADDWEPVA